MGSQRVLQAIAAVATVAASSVAGAAPRLNERVAVIDLGGTAASDIDVARQLQAAVVTAGFEPVIGDGVEDALVGRDVERDELRLGAALANAQRAFGELRCADATPAAHQAIGLAAARQAAGRPAPELARAWSLVLLCADRENRVDAALAAAQHLRTLGGSPDVPASILDKYPAIDVVANRELVELEIDAEVPGAEVWIDFRSAGKAPVRVVVPAGEHVIAAAAGTRRGWATGAAVRTQKSLRVPLYDAAGPWSEVARRITSWRGKVPPPAELASVLARVRTRVALVRHGDTVEAWGRIGPSEALHLLGGDDGIGPVADAARVLAVVADRVRTWNERAPDPDRPLLVESSEGREGRDGRKDAPERKTRWWVYGAIAAAAAIATTIIIVQDSATDRQRVELHFP